MTAFLKAAGLKPKRTSVQAPWQNGLAERWIGSCRREILDHIIPLNEPHLRRIMRDYVLYHHEDRLHDSLAKDAPNRRVVEQRTGVNAKVVSMARLGGLQHRYGWRQAAQSEARLSNWVEHRCTAEAHGRWEQRGGWLPIFRRR